MLHPIFGRGFRLLACATLALAVATVAIAGEPKAKVKPVELEPTFMLEASGTIVVAPDGTVAEAIVLTEFDDLIRNALARSVGRLRFEPIHVNGVAVAGRTGFHAVLLGRKHDGGLVVTMDSIDFRAPKGQKPEAIDEAKIDIVSRQMNPPKYPTGPERAGVMGKVKLLIRVAPDGTAADVGVVDSYAWDNGVSKSTARSGLRELELAAVSAARKWTFEVPADAAKRSASDMTVGTSVAFVFELRSDVKLDKEGQWLPVMKAPKREVAWLQPVDSKRFADTALASGSLSGGSTFKLVTPVGGTSVF